MTPSRVLVERQPLWFLILFALAVSGVTVAYVPLLTVVLPLKVVSLMGGEDVATLARITFFGALIASISNIAFGILSDRFGNRIFWIVAGLLVSNVLLLAIGRASSPAEVIVLVMAWQVGLNMMLAPLMAWAGDCFPDEQKGTLGGLLALAPAVGALSGSLVTVEAIMAPQWRLSAVAFIVTAFVLPAVIFGRGQTRGELLRPVADSSERDDDPLRRRPAIVRLWLARFLVQISEAGLFAYLLFWLRSIVEGFEENTAANLYSVVLVIAVPLSLLLGRWSDRNSRPILPLSIMAMLSAAGLLVMAATQGIGLALLGYVIFGTASVIFLSLHTAQTLRVLPKPQNRGRDLGLFNLTNTLPSMVMPWLTLALVPAFGFSALFVCFAILIGLAAGLLASVAKPIDAS